MGHMGVGGERERGGQGRLRAPSPLGLNWTREGGRRSPFLLPLLLSPSLPLGGILLGLGVLVELLSLARPTEAGRPPPPLLYIRGQGGTSLHTIYDILAVCGAPLHHITPR